AAGFPRFSALSLVWNRMIKDIGMFLCAVLVGLALVAAFATLARAQEAKAPFTSAKVTNCGSIPGRGRQATLEQAFRAGYLRSVRSRFASANGTVESAGTVRHPPALGRPVSTMPWC